MSESQQKQTYDWKYDQGYRETLSGYEVARWRALERFIPRCVPPHPAWKILDYGAGSGLFLPLWVRLFPNDELFFCDISQAALQRFGERFPAHAGNYRVLSEMQAPFPDESFDLIVSVEVLEHVEDLDALLRDMHRLLKPKGRFIWTTPCGNRLSIEHVYARLSGQIEVSSAGGRRWKWEEPTHLRRLKSGELKALLKKTGFIPSRIRFRAHCFSFLCSRPLSRLPNGWKERLMDLDYQLFRVLPNGASMIGCAIKTGEAPEAKKIAEVPRLPRECDPAPTIGSPQKKAARAAVVIPCFNMGEYLAEAVESAVKQTVRDVEIIVVDDGSSDSHTQSVLTELRHQGIRVLRKKNGGVADARNHGIGSTEAEFICCLDADDCLEPQYLEKTIARLEQDKDKALGFVTTWVRTFGNESRVVRTAGFDRARLCIENQVHVASLFRREAWRRVNGYRTTLRGYQDWDFWLALVEAGFHWDVLMEPLFRYRVRTGSMVTHSDRIRPELIAEIAQAHIALFAAVLPDVLREKEQRLMAFQEVQSALLEKRLELAAVRLNLTATGKRRCYCFGTGQFADLLLKHLDPGRFEIAGFFDNDPGKHGGTKNGLMVMKPFWQSDPVVIASRWTTDIARDLQKLGYTEEQLVVPRL